MAATITNSLKVLDFVTVINTGQVESVGGTKRKNWEAVQGDTFMLVAHCQHLLGTTPTDFPLDTPGTPQAVRCRITDARKDSPTEYSFQDAYNGGDFATYENLAEGKFTMLISLNTAAIDGAFTGDAESISAYLELSFTNADGLPQTLLQLPGTIYAELDDGAVGTPPPSSPTYSTAAEVLVITDAKQDAVESIDVDMTATGQTVIHTCPNGSVFIPETLKIVTTAITTAGAAAVFKVGTGTTDDLYLTGITTISNGLYAVHLLDISGNDAIAATETIELGITGASGAVSHTAAACVAGQEIKI